MRRTLSGCFTLPVPAEGAVGWFTPEGERAWVPGWDPVHADPAVTDAPGAVWCSGDGARRTTWVTVDRTASTVRYARVTPQLLAGTVTVTCTAAAPQETEVVVTYDLTALGERGRRQLALFAEAYPGMLETWRADLLATVQAGP